MITILLYVVLGGFAWLVVGVLIALGIGAIIRNRDGTFGHPDDDWLADQPVEVLSPAEITRRLLRTEQWL